MAGDADLLVVGARIFTASSERPWASALAVAGDRLLAVGTEAQAARWAELRDEIGQSFARTDALNLDRKQTILGAFFTIDGAAR